MGIRNAVKAIILDENMILLNRCNSPEIGDYFALPGGGQSQHETMEDAVVREVLEETGYTVVPKAFVALYEEIYTCHSVRQRHPDHSHKILHVFRCVLSDKARGAAVEQDLHQTGCAWVDLDDISGLNLLPAAVGRNIRRLAGSEAPLYLGSHFIDGER